MIKRTLYFGNPAYLSLKDEQMVIKKPDACDSDNVERANTTIPIEDIGVVVLDNRRITITTSLISALLNNNAAIVSCDEKCMPAGLILPLQANSIQSERFRDQLSASLPLKKRLWQQTVMSKIRNQAAILQYITGVEARNMLSWASKVKSGDSDNLEARAAAFYWKNLFPDYDDFTRDRYNPYPNNLLNYGYAILRAIIARSLVGTGLLPTLGIHHHNRYNAYCLADDIMEPYRPYVDKLVIDIVAENSALELNKEVKSKLLSIPVLDVKIDGHTSPLMIAATTTTSSLYKCFSGVSRKIIYPEL